MMPRHRTTWAWWKTSTVAGLLTVSAGGAVTMLDGVSEVRWLVGLNLVVVGIMALLASAIAAWLGDAAPVPPAPVTGDTPPARLVFVVRRDRRDLYEQLQVMFARQENVQTVLDRRERPRDAFDREVMRRGWSVARVEV
jgi:hypothetical protein